VIKKIRFSSRTMAIQHLNHCRINPFPRDTVTVSFTRNGAVSIKIVILRPYSG